MPRVQMGRAGKLLSALAFALALAACQAVPGSGRLPADVLRTPGVRGVSMALLTPSLLPTWYPGDVTATSSATPGPAILTKTENVLLMGVDHRPADPDPSWRTDSIIIAALDRANNRLGLVNIPRDLYVEIAGYGPGRINQADYIGERGRYPGGGPALVERVLTETLGIPIDHYVRIQMAGLVDLVDALGGVTVTLKCPLYERTPDETSSNGLRDWNLPAGQVRLDGQDARQFATYRYVESDFGRTRRQQQLIWAIRNQALQLNALPRIPTLWRALSDNYETDLSLIDAVKYASLGADLRPENVRGLVFSLDALDYAYTGTGAIVLVIKDKQRLQDELAHLFDGKPLASLDGSAAGEAGECPPPPTAVPAFTPTPIVTATMTAGPTVVLSGTLTLTPTITATPELTATLAPG